MHVVLNGGINTFDEAETHLYSEWQCPTDQQTYPAMDGIMIGRAAYNNPWLFQDADRYVYACVWSEVGEGHVCVFIWEVMGQGVGAQ